MNFGQDWINAISGGGTYSYLFFVPFALLVLFAAMRLVKFSEVIIVKTKFGGAFVGGVLIAAITSIPELVSEVTQSLEGNPAASISNELGSNAFSALLIALTIVIMFKTPFMKNLGRWSRIMMMTSAVLSFFVSIFMFVEHDVNWGFPHAIIGLVPLTCFVVFFIMLVAQHKLGDDDEIEPENIANVTVKGAVWRISAWALALIIVSLGLNFTIDSMMSQYDWLSAGSAGGIFLAFAGSLPEIVAFIMLVKKKRYVGGVAALIGSHIFNFAITFFGDLSYGDSSYYSNSSMSDAAPLAILTGCMMLMLWIQSLISHKIGFKNNALRLVIPSLVVVGYILGWVLMLVF